MEQIQHPGRQQQGLGAPTAQSNPYVTPNAALQAAQTQQASAQADKARAEAVMMQQAGQNLGLGTPVPQQVTPGPQVMPQEVQAQQIADGILRGQVDQNSLQAMIQAGEVDPAVAQAAFGMAQQVMQKDQQVGLGGL